MMRVLFACLFAAAIAVSNISLSQSQTNNAQDEKKYNSECYIIRKLDYPIYKRVDPKNKTEKKICLLNICPERAGEIARPSIEVEINGKKEHRVFDIEKVFKNKEEAQEFVKKYEIKDVKYE